MKVLCVIGTRPEAIKMAPVVLELAKHPRRIDPLVCATGQHRELASAALEVFGIRPDVELDALAAGQTLARLTARLFEGLDRVVGDARPDWILAQGDTTSVMVAAMVAFYHQVAFGHVEAGLRTGDRRRPFPEEMNRRFADGLADLCFAPTERARENLLREGAAPRDVLLTGNTVIDALLEAAGRQYDWSRGPLAGLGPDGPVVLITAHRRESFGAPLREVCQAIGELAAAFADDGVRFVLPVHPNPNVRRPVEELLRGIDNLLLVEPLDYLSLVQLMKRSALILTDSGGIQEEAPSLGVPVLVLRDEVERPEGIEAGAAILVGTRRERIVKEASRLLLDPKARAEMKVDRSPYGDGKAAGRIVEALLERRGR
jgi:UDP-N-acetylglucosamine 2-epimerase (non-hydrolysing)